MFNYKMFHIGDIVEHKHFGYGKVVSGTSEGYFGIAFEDSARDRILHGSSLRLVQTLTLEGRLIDITDGDSKPTNPKDAIGCDKLPLHLWPTTATAIGSIAFLEGALKYGRSNWRESGVKSTIYVDACRRHLDAWLEGEEVAPDTGTPHLSSALACLAIIVDAQAAGKLNDDRNYNGSGYRKLVDNLTPHVRRLKNLFADKNPKHYTIEDNQ